MYSIQLPWKLFSVNLQLVDVWAKAQLSTYVGNSADYQLTLWFSEEPSSETASAVESYWDSLSAESSEAQSYVTVAQIAEATSLLKTNLLSKTWDEMSQTEKKLVMNLPVTRQDLGL